MLLPEANPTITTAISQQKRNRSPKIIYRKQRGEGGWRDPFSTYLSAATADRLEVTRVPPGPLRAAFSFLLPLPPSVWERSNV